MAEAVAIGLASNAVTLVVPPAFRTAYETACSVLGAKNELDAITNTIKVIESKLQEAEKQQYPDSGVLIKVLIERLKEVMYDADDLFDEVATNDLIKKQMEGIWKQYLKEVRVFFSKQNQVVSNYSIVKKVKSIRMKLDQIKEDKAIADIVPCVEHSTHSTKVGSWLSLVDPKDVIGRDDDKAAILEFLCDKKYADKDISLISIVGIGGMGKTSLAQLVYQDRKILNDFNDDRRWWACISNINDPVLIAEKIFHAITGSDEKGLDIEQLRNKIRKCVDNQERFFLVLDDLWEEERDNGLAILSLLRSDSVKGSKIMITTRSSLVSMAMNVDKTHKLEGLANDASWELFKTFAFSEEPEKGSNWDILGKKIMEKCANVPLAIRSIASVLHRKHSLDQWEAFEGEELSAIVGSDGFISIMSALRLSYYYLPSDLKRCFAYCSLFEKDTILYKKNLVNLWIAQGYVNPTIGSLETEGNAYFMELFWRCFFCEVKEDSNGDIESCKMHDLVHDLAQEVAGTGILVLKERVPPSIPKETRHVSVGCKIDESWSIPPPLLQADRRLRSFLFLPRNIPGQLVLLDRKVTKFRFLRALNLGGLNIKVVPGSVGKLKFMRYLNLSRNKEFKALPNSITKLVNLQTLDLSGCLGLKVLPNEFRKLISLRHLDISGCDSLRHMPPRFGELTSLQHVSDFKVGKGGAADDEKDGGLAALVGLKLRGQLRISYDKEGGWLRDEMMLQYGQIPETIDGLSIHDYPNAKIPVWWNENSNSLQLKLTSIRLERCKRVRHLPSFRRLPNLRDLVLDEFEELEYLEEEEVVSNASFFPSLVFLELTDLPKLEGWSRGCKAVTTSNEEQSIQNPEQPSFPKLLRLCIHSCYSLKSLPPSPHLHQLSMLNPTKEMVQELVSANASSSSLRRITIQALENVKSFPGERLTSVRRLELRGWPALENVQLPSNARVEELTILRCRKLMLWDHGKEKTGVDWGHLASLRVLGVDQIPKPEELPNCLGQRVEQGLLQIKKKK